MALQPVNLGIGTTGADTLYAGAVKINANFTEVYAAFGDGTNLVSYAKTSGVSTTSGYAVVSGYSTSSGIATNANYSVVSGYSTSSGISTLSLTSNYGIIAGYSTNSGIASYAGYAAVAGIATNATSASYATIAGISTTSQGLTGTPNITVGVITATSGVQGIGIYSGGSLVTTGIVTALNFVGTGNTFAVVGNRIDISIVGGAGGGVNYWNQTGAGINTLSNVGIGTTNPSDALTILGNIQIQQNVSSTDRLIFRGQPTSSYRWNIDNNGSSNTFRIFREDDATGANGSVAVSISTTGTVTATKFVGDGSGLTGISAGGGTATYGGDTPIGLLESMLFS